MNILLWTLQALLAAQFLIHGWLFVSPPPDLAPLLNAAFPVWFRLLLGVAELLAGVGLILPGVTRVLPRLVPLAALGVMIVTASATGFHLVRGELVSALTTAALFVMAAFVAYMRLRVRPIAPRQAAGAVTGSRGELTDR